MTTPQGPSAKDRTLDMFLGDPTPPEKLHKTRMSEEDADEPMLKWINSDITHPEYSVRIAKYKNGHRGIQCMRKGVSMSCMLLTPEMYAQLERCVLLGSLQLRQVAMSYPELREMLVSPSKKV